MPDPVITGLFAIVTAVVGGIVAYRFNRRRQELEIKNLENQLLAYKEDRDRAHQETERLKLETQLLQNQVSAQQEDRDKARTEVKKLELEVQILTGQLEAQQSHLDAAALRAKELKLLTDEWWKRYGARTQSLLAQQRELTWELLQDAFVVLVREEQISSLDFTVQSLARRLSRGTRDESPSEREVVCALLDIDQINQEIRRQEQDLYQQESYASELPDEEKRKLHTECWNRRHHLDALRDRVGQLRQEFLRSSLRPGMALPALDLDHADLHGMNLSRVNLTDASLWHARLQHTNLQGAHLRGARLFRASLTGANLQGACLAGVDLDHAYLVGANLDGADLTGASLCEAVLTEASLRNTILTGAKYTKKQGIWAATEWPKGFDPEAAGAIVDKKGN